jgi:hypothetical protein
MKNLSFVAFTVTALLFSGCSSKKYFEAENTFSASHVSKSYGGDIVDLSRDGGTLSNGNYLGKKGVKAIHLGEGYRFLNENATYVLAANAEGMLKVISKKSKDAIRKISLHTPVVSATIRKGVIAYILNNNTFGIYLMKGNKKIVESRSERTFAIDTRAASPMFIENLAVMPMLDGKLIIIDIRNTQNAKVVYISSEKVFNNVIYLSRIGNTMVAATPKRVITLGTAGKLEYRANISEVAVTKNKIYLFTKEGKVLALNTNLEVQSEAKFKFAHYAVATVLHSKVYALDQHGSLIVLSANLKKSKVYDVGAVKEAAFIAGSKLYKDGDVIELSKLGYE